MNSVLPPLGPEDVKRRTLKRTRASNKVVVETKP